ncbi:MAG: hypothetical protein GT600_11590 [Bacteroidales bacterium]|jgi:hypothetical protein|nr:hypothetical protein [Bacteroidales bacterium]NMD03726.1 hypothetical protein [Bacteroidales bacterium]OQB65026.1 MAG: hypothetical protein BWX96_00523 [Bacteroidetes bacterium ADurb.Bin145]
MKKLNLYPVVFLSLILLTFTSCEKDKPLAEAIIGTWEIQDRTVVVYENGIKKESHTEYLEADEMVFQFVSGGTGIYYEYTSNHVFNWALANATLVISNLFEEDLQAELTIDGDVMILSYDETNSQQPSVKYEYYFTGYRVN